MQHNDKDDEKKRRIEKKLHDFMADTAIELLDKEDLDQILLIIKKRLHAAGVGFSNLHMKSFSAGFEFGMYASKNDQEIPTLAGLRYIIKQEDDKVTKKVDESLKREK